MHITMAGVPVISRDDVAFIPIQDLAPAALGLIWKTARHSAKVRALAGAAWAPGPLRVTYSTAADRPPDVGTSGPDSRPAAG